MESFCTKCGTAFSDGQSFCGKCGAPRAGASHPEAEAEVATAVKKTKGAVVSAGISILLLGLVPFVIFSKGCTGSAKGSVVVAGGSHPGFSFTPTGCASMQPTGHMGANLHGEGSNDGAVYVTMDPISGPEVNVEVPGSCRNENGSDCLVFPVPRQKCTRFEANVEHTGVTVNDVPQVRGQVAVDCKFEDGTTVKGQVTFDGCS